MQRYWFRKLGKDLELVVGISTVREAFPQILPEFGLLIPDEAEVGGVAKLYQRRNRLPLSRADDELNGIRWSYDGDQELIARYRRIQSRETIAYRIWIAQTSSATRTSGSKDLRLCLRVSTIQTTSRSLCDNSCRRTDQDVASRY